MIEEHPKSLTESFPITYLRIIFSVYGIGLYEDYGGAPDCTVETSCARKISKETSILVDWTYL